MNSLSWFLYFADVLPAISSTVGITSFVLFIFSAIVSFVIFLNSREKFGDKEYGDKVFKLVWLRVAPLLFVFLILSLLIPSKETIYLIAGSEAGEAVVNSEQGKEVLNDIHEVIKYQLESLKGEKNG